ncbi:AfsR/SARP family transcriptional regulator [Streptomyces sp. NPDC055254]
MAPTRPGAHRPAAAVDFRLLGDLDVRLGGVRWKAPSRKPRRMLAALLLEPRRQVPKDRLVEAVWDGEPPRSAAGAIQVYASQLRRVLPGCDLVCSGEGYLLDIEPAAVDLHRFRLLVASAQALPDEARAGQLREALGLFRGEPLADIGSDTLRRAFEPVIVEERLSTLEHLVELELALGRGDRLLPELLRLTREHPLRERLWEQLVRCQVRAGHRMGAAASYEQARRLLREELGVDPGPGLRDARRQIDACPPEPLPAWRAEHRLPVPAGGTAPPPGPGAARTPEHPGPADPRVPRPAGSVPRPTTAPPSSAQGVPAPPVAAGGARAPGVPADQGSVRAARDDGSPARPVPAPGLPADGGAVAAGAGRATSGAAAAGAPLPGRRLAQACFAEPSGRAEADSRTGAENIGPRMLPRDLVDFTGRTAELDRAAALVRAAGSGAAILAVTGMAGVGKTALATRVAHRASAAYPDGQLFVDLHGHSAERDPLPAHEALDLLLRMAGEPCEHPTGDGAGTALSAARWRATLARRRMIVVLDNAADAAHIRPLLPGDSASLVVITSRGPLAEVDGAHQLPLGVLSAAEASALFTGITGITGTAGTAGPESPERRGRAAAEVARLCGNLPLAVRLAAVRLRERPTWPAEELVGRLRGDHALDELRLGSRSVSQAFHASYRSLTDAERRVFRCLGLLPGPDADAAAITALTAAPPSRLRPVLESLLDRNLLEQHASNRFRLHPLLRRYALRAAGREDAEPARRAAVGRLADHYLVHARSAVRMLRPPRTLLALDGAEPLFPHARAAARWLAVERPNLTAAAYRPAAALPVERTRALVQLLLRHDELTRAALRPARQRELGQGRDLGRQRAVALEGRSGLG